VTDTRSHMANEVLKDGTSVTIRAIRRGDAQSVLQAFSKFDRDSIYQRFFQLKKELTSAELIQITEVDFSQVFALVATTQTRDGEILIGGGRFVSDPDESWESADLAFITDDAYQGRGVASLILKHLVKIARERRIVRFKADVLADNRSMMRVFQRSGLPMLQKRGRNVIHVTLTL
jgi:RimJ/RimL family protein N-acetyltransferase